MSAAELIMIAIGLSMDAFAVSISNGMVIKNKAKCILYAALCGAFQAIMPLIGYILGSAAAVLISRFDHWVALIALGVIGGKTLIEAISELRKKDGSSAVREPSVGMLIMQAIATSIDALIVGVSLAALGTDIAVSSAAIGAVTFCLCLVGAFFGRRLGSSFGTKSAAVGGVILLLLGIKTFIEHTLLI